VRDPETLLRVTDRIGTDFIYRDYGLSYHGGREYAKHAMEALRDMRSRSEQFPIRTPELAPADLVREWTVRVGELRGVPGHLSMRSYDSDGWDDEDDESQRFDDVCSHLRQRLDKTYRTDTDRPSSWRCDRVIDIPADALRSPGAYVLSAQANGQRVFAPIVVDPMSLTLRRCRDGVFVLASSSDGLQPEPGAQVHARGMTAPATTDANGAAFAKVFAAGDRALVVRRGDRWAVAGFGRVFEGVYRRAMEDERHHLLREVVSRMQRARQLEEQTACVYADGTVVAAYTDRPTYRPGQPVRFKLIVRRLDPSAPAVGAEGTAFRAEDFDIHTCLRLPDADTSVRWEMLDPKGRTVATGTCTLNDFGTAAGEAELNAETMTGAYALRVRVGNLGARGDRIVPGVFAVRHYRRPNFELTFTDAPDTAPVGGELRVATAARHYFGKPVTQGQVDVRLVRADRPRPLAQAQSAIDGSGVAVTTLKIAGDAPSGEAVLVAVLTDASGRAVTRTKTVTLTGGLIDRPATGLTGLPVFAPVEANLVVASAATAVTARRVGGKVQSFPVNAGRADVKLPAPGWYELRAGDEATRVFAYGGSAHPLTFADDRVEEAKQLEKGRRDDDDRAARWVNLTDYRLEADGEPETWSDPDRHVWALLDRRHAEVGAALRLLVYSRLSAPRLVFTLEGASVNDYRIIRAEGGHYHVIELPVGERQVPNFYLQARVIAGAALAKWGDSAGEAKQSDAALKEREEEEIGDDPRWCRIDVVDRRTSASKPELNVRVQTDRPSYRPGDEVSVRLRVTDRDDRPALAEVSLAAVDESLFAFGEDALDALGSVFRSPRPPQRYFRKTWRSFVGTRWKPASGEQLLAMAKSMEMAKALQQAMQKSADAALQSLGEVDRLPSPARWGEMPATTLTSVRLRTDFRETAAWLPQLRTGADGVASAKFKLPDSLTRYRLSAVGLTKQTQIGVGRAAVTAVLPLSVQVMLPRFAVEGDRLQAVGLIHNPTGADRDCAVEWRVEGARVEGATTARVSVPAGRTARVALWLMMEHMGMCHVSLKTADATDSDGEQRSIPVHGVGREREVALNGVLAITEPTDKNVRPTDARRHTLKLPAGFRAGDLQLTLSCTTAAQALEGLGYLVEYPHGCVEQTMSRFLPAVMVGRAVRQSGVDLPPDVAAKLPQVLSRGLTRLYTFQHADGGWGWWEKDATNIGMSIYVVYGLARCRGAGAAVDEGVLQRGCDFLLAELGAGRLGEHLPRAMVALAAAGRIDADVVAGTAQRLHATGKLRTEDRLDLASACLAVNRQELARRVMPTEVPQTTAGLAERLNVQAALGEPAARLHDTAKLLLDRRAGDRWHHTRDTSWAIEALSNLLTVAPDKTVLQSLSVTVGGRLALQIRGSDRLVHRIRLADGQLPATEAIEIDMQAVGVAPVSFTLRASGVQRQDRMEPEGAEVKVHRVLQTLDGRPLPESLAVGDVIAVRLTVELTAARSFVMLQDRRPAGCEFADDTVLGTAAGRVAQSEFRDDRLCVYFAGLPAGRHELVYHLRAETPGSSRLLPAFAYPMYDEKLRGETGSDVIRIAAP